MTAVAVQGSEDLRADERARVEERIERLLADRTVKKFQRALYGHIYRTWARDTVELWELEWMLGRLERARM